MSNPYTNGVADQHLDLVPGFSTNPIEGTSAGCTFTSGIPGPYNSAASAAANSVVPGTALGTAQLYFDPCAFSLPPTLSGGIAYGTLGRNTMRLPGLVQLDFTLKKDTRVGEGKNLEFRFEAYNFLNHVNLGNPGLSEFSTSGTLTSSTVARIKTSSVSRQIQLALRFTF